MRKDPRVYERELPRIALPYKRIVGLDLASSAGVSFCDIIPGQPVTDGKIIGGQWDLSLSNYDTQSMRTLRLQAFLEVLNPDLILYEEVKFTGTNPAPGASLTAIVARAVRGAQVVHSLCAVLTHWAEMRDIPTEAVPIGVIKKYATGKGNSGKAVMIESCNAKFGTNFDPDTYESTGVDNIADSMFICAMGVQNYSEALQ